MSLSDDVHNETRSPETSDAAVVDSPTSLDAEYYQETMAEGYRAIKGAILAVLAAEIILLAGGITGKPLWAFPSIGGLLIIRHVWQIRQARQQLDTLANKD
jgi:hypothetical protein